MSKSGAPGARTVHDGPAYDVSRISMCGLGLYISSSLANRLLHIHVPLCQQPEIVYRLTSTSTLRCLCAQSKGGDATAWLNVYSSVSPWMADLQGWKGGAHDWIDMRPGIQRYQHGQLEYKNAGRTR